MTKKSYRKTTILLLTFLCLLLALSACTPTIVDPKQVMLTQATLLKSPSHAYPEYNDSELDFCIQKDEEFVVELHFSNPLGYPIFNVQINDTYISNIKFLKDSTPQKVRIAYTFPEVEEHQEKRDIIIKKFTFTYLGNPVEHILTSPIKLTVRQEPQFVTTLLLGGESFDISINYMQSLENRIFNDPLLPEKVTLAKYVGVYTQEFGEGTKVENYFFFENTTLYIFTMDVFAFARNDEGTEFVVTGLSPSGWDISNQLIEIPSVYQDPVTLEVLPVTSIADGAFTGRIITLISIPDSIKMIGEGAFKNCARLSRINMTSSSQLAEIKSSAFEGTKNLTRFGLTRELTTIGSRAFYNSGLKETQSSPANELIIPAGITRIGERAFSKTDAKAVRFAEGSTLTYMQDYAFAEMDNLTTLSTKYGESLEAVGIKTIGKYAFYKCIKLATVNLGVGLERIESNAFRDCSALRRITLHKDIEVIGEQAFMQCDLTTFNIASGSGLLSIGNQAFRGNQSLDKLDLTNASRLEQMGGRLFEQCSALRQVRLGATTPPSANAELIYYSSGYLKFYVKESKLDEYKNKWSNVTLPTGRQLLMSEIKYISADNKWAAQPLNDGVMLFDVFGSATSVSVPSTLFGDRPVTEIGPYAFHSGLRSVTLPSSVKVIHNRAFYECTQLQEVNFNALVQLESIGEEAFYKTAITSFVAKGALATIEKGAFSMTAALTFADFRGASEITIMADSFGSSNIREAYFGEQAIINGGAFNFSNKLEYLWFANVSPNDAPYKIESTSFNSRTADCIISIPSMECYDDYKSIFAGTKESDFEIRE